MTNYATQPLEILNADLNAAKEGVDSLSNYYDKTEVDTTILTLSSSLSSCLSSEEFDNIEELESSVELSDVIEKINEMICALKRVEPEPVYSTTTRVVYTDDTTAEFDIVGTLGSNSITNQSSVKDLSVGSHVTAIGDNAFQSKSNLTAVTLPNTIITIGGNAFLETGIKEITIKNGVTSIGGGCFARCPYLQEVHLPNTLTSVGVSLFQDDPLLSSINIPTSLSVLEQHMFQRCYALSSMTIPSSVTRIGHSVFNTCTALTAVNIPESVVELGYGNYGSSFAVFGGSPTTVTFENRTKSQVQSITGFRWGIETDKIVCTDGNL